jgi:hypothetical protein
MGAARAFTLRLLRRAADVFDARLDRFLAISSLLLLHRRRDTVGGHAIVVYSVVTEVR